jgi:hypothetical protein
MDRLIFFLICFGIGFWSGYGVRAMISLRRRREERRKWEERVELRKGESVTRRLLDAPRASG